MILLYSDKEETLLPLLYICCRSMTQIDDKVLVSRPGLFFNKVRAINGLTPVRYRLETNLITTSNHQVF